MDIGVDQLLEEFDQTQKRALSEGTLLQYEQHYKLYENFILNKDGTDHQNLLDLQNIKIFLAYRKQTNKCYNTIMADISSLRYFCEKNNIPDVTKDPQIKYFKKGLKRILQAGTNPHASVPLEKHHYLQIFELVKPTNPKIECGLVYIILQYYALLRVSEVLSLKKKDLIFMEDDLNGLFIKIHIGKTKKDQDAVGRKVYIFSDPSFPQNVNYVKTYYEKINDGFIFPGKAFCYHLSDTTIRRYLKKIIALAGVEPMHYTTHSIRKGAAQRLAQNGTAPEAIRYQGGWKSTVFMEYTKFDAEKTAKAIKNKF